MYVKLLIKKRDHGKFKNSLSPDKPEKFKQARNHLRYLTRKIIAQYEDFLAIETKENPKKKSEMDIREKKKVYTP